MRALQLRGSRAVEILSRESQGPAAQTDLQPGDLIVAVNGEVVDGIDTLHRLLGRVPPGSELRPGHRAPHAAAGGGAHRP